MVAKINPDIKKNSDSRFLITIIWVGSEAGVNGPVIFMGKGKKVHHRLRYKKLVTRYGFTEGYCVIPNKAEYMDDETLQKVLKVLDPGIRKTKVINIACVSPILLFIYLTLHICPSKLSSDDL